MNEKYKQDFIQAGAIAKEVRLFGKALIQKGTSYNAVITQINEKILELGAQAAFPPQIALNNVAAHFLPQPDEDIIFADDIVKLDIGVSYKGAIGDCAVTIDLSGKYQKLIEAAEAGLLAAEQSIKVGQPVREIGKIIEDTITSYGYTSIKNLCGHGLGRYKIHTSPLIPNYNDRSKAIIKPGMTFAIEPFATDGQGMIYESGTPAIFSFVAERPVKLKSGHFLLEKIKAFDGLPFAIHHLIGPSHSVFETKQALMELLNVGIIEGYPPLLEEAQGMVSQAENSVLVDKDGKVYITTR